jgi:hypothetical protein
VEEMAGSNLESIGLMRGAPITLLPLLAVFGCAGLRLSEQPYLILDGIPIYGQMEKIPEPTLRAAIAVDQSLLTTPPHKIYLIDIVNRSEIHVYYTRRNPRWEEYRIYELVAGEWRVRDRVVGGSIRFP